VAGGTANRRLIESWEQLNACVNGNVGCRYGDMARYWGRWTVDGMIPQVLRSSQQLMILVGNRWNRVAAVVASSSVAPG